MVASFLVLGLIRRIFGVCELYKLLILLDRLFEKSTFHTVWRLVRLCLGQGPTLSQSTAAEDGIPQPPLPLDHLGQRLLEYLFTDAMALQTLHQRRHRVLLQTCQI